MLALLVAFATGAHAGREPEGVFGAVNGVTYTFAALEASPHYVKARRKEVAPEHVDATRYWEAMTAFREIALAAASRHVAPDCRTAPSDSEREAFIGWWRGHAIAIRNALVEVHTRRNPGQDFRLEPPLDRLEHEIVIGNALVVEAADRKIERWLVNRCLYRTYGGGRVHRFIGPHRFVEPGETLLVAHVAYAGYPYPAVTSTGNPLAAYLAAFEQAEADGVIAFPDDGKREDFYLYAHRTELRFFDPEDEEAAIETEYWMHPLVPYQP